MVSASAKNTAWNGLVNGYVDLGTYAGFTPYVGAGIGLLRTKTSFNVGATCQNSSVTDTSNLDNGDGTSTTTDQTVDFTLREGQPAALAYNDILGNVFVYPSSVYGKFVTKQVEEDVPAYFTENQKDPTKAGKMDAFKRISTAFQKLASYKVPRRVLFFSADDLQLTGSAKVKTADLRALAARRLEAD